MTYRVLKIEEDVDFGCEERPEGVPVMAVLTIQDAAGKKQIIRYPDELLYKLGINEGSFISIDPGTGEIQVSGKTEESRTQGIPPAPQNVYEPAAAAAVLHIARSYLENAGRLIYSYGSKTFLSGYDLFDREHGGRGNIDCSTFILLVLAGVPFEKSPYGTGGTKGLELHPLAELDFSCFEKMPEKYIGIAERIGRPYLAGPRGLDLDRAKELGITLETLRDEIFKTGMSRRSVSLAMHFLKRNECYLDPAFRKPGDLVFYRSSEFFVDETSDYPKETDISHVGILSGNTDLMINSSGYLNKKRAQEEGLPAVSVSPVFGKRTPAFFARPKYLKTEQTE